MKVTISNFFRILFPSARLRKFIRRFVISTRGYKELLLIEESRRNYSETLLKLRAKKRIRVVFFFTLVAKWKYHCVYVKMKKTDYFEPIVAIIPFIDRGDDFMIEEMNRAEIFCIRAGYNFVNSRDDQKDGWKDIKGLLSPDIVFFSHPYNITFKNYLIDNFMDCLTCYVPYSIRQEVIYGFKFDTWFQNIVWKNYYESFIQLDLAKKYARNRGKNVVVSGYPPFEELLEGSRIKPDIWKPQEKKKFKIIWAPHWTIRGHQHMKLDWSTFLTYCDKMLQLAISYEDSCQFALKPHPNLKSVLADDKLWGKTKTENYFAAWENLKNGQVNDAGYIELFAGSDALIHDSGSFMIEYLILNKPALYLTDSKNLLRRFNKYGRSAIECHYVAHNFDEIQNFVQRVLLIGEDNLYEKRALFIDSVIRINNRTGAENILNDLYRETNYQNLARNWVI